MNLKLEINLLINQVHNIHNTNQYNNTEAVLAHLRNELKEINNLPDPLLPYRVVSLNRYLKLVLPHRGHPLREQIEQKLAEIMQFSKAKFYKKPLPVTTGNL